MAVTPPCAARQVGVVVQGEVAPPHAVVTSDGERTSVALAGSERAAGATGTLARYAIPGGGEPLVLVLPAGTALASSATDRVPELALAGAPGDPVGAVYCRVPDSAEQRFAQRFAFGHLALPYLVVLRWPVAWLVAAVLALACRQGGGRSPSRTRRYQR